MTSSASNLPREEIEWIKAQELGASQSQTLDGEPVKNEGSKKVKLENIRQCNLEE